jgi:hypothetical protein
MSTRGGTAASSRRVKQELVRILFGPKYAGKGPEAHRRLDHSIYKYSDLRTAYLERMHELHPDKYETDNQQHHSMLKNQFVQLKEAWNRYEEVAKMMKRVDGDSTAANFTRFGVGCSFSDNETERAERTEIMDQAGRGWFSAGALPCGQTSAEKKQQQQASVSHRVPLADDDYFVHVESSMSSAVTSNARKTLLIQNFIHPSRR